MLSSAVFRTITPLDLRDDMIAFEAIADFASTCCQIYLSSWTLSPEELIRWAESKHVRLSESFPTICEAIAQWLPSAVYGGNEMPIDAHTLVAGIEIELINYRHDQNRPRKAGCHLPPPHQTTIEISSNLNQNIDHEKDKSFLSAVDVMVTLDENMNIKRIYCDG